MAQLQSVFLDLESIQSSRDYPDGFGKELKHWSKDKVLTMSNVLDMGFCIGCSFNEYTIKLWHDPYELLQYLMDDSIGQIITFNGEWFDFNLLVGSLIPLQNGEFTPEYKEISDTLESKSVDLQVYIEASLGHAISLDSISRLLLGCEKEMDGQDFCKNFISEDIPSRVKATNYVIADVLNLYKIYGCAMVNGMIGYIDKLGQKQSFKLSVPALNPPF